MEHKTQVRCGIAVWSYKTKGKGIDERGARHAKTCNHKIEDEDEDVRQVK